MRAGWPLLFGLLLCGCGLLSSAQPEWVANRLPLASCGEEVLERGDTDVEARQCLLDAFRAGEGAELISTQAAGQDGQITRYLRVHENGRSRSSPMPPGIPPDRAPGNARPARRCSVRTRYATSGSKRCS